EPARFPGRASQVTIQTHAAFCNYKRFTGNNPFVKRFVQPHTFVFQNTSANVDSSRVEKPKRAAPMFRIRINRTDDYPPNSAPDDIVCAGRSSSTGRARLERYVKDSFFWNGIIEFSQAIDFR